jgi:hypothetical protein
MKKVWAWTDAADDPMATNGSFLGRNSGKPTPTRLSKCALLLFDAAVQ